MRILFVQTTHNSELRPSAGFIFETAERISMKFGIEGSALKVARSFNFGSYRFKAMQSLFYTQFK
jgi:hypothetical protein